VVLSMKIGPVTAMSVLNPPMVASQKSLTPPWQHSGTGRLRPLARCKSVPSWRNFPLTGMRAGLHTVKLAAWCWKSRYTLPNR
jgi:hypothetical protein